MKINITTRNFKLSHSSKNIVTESIEDKLSRIINDLDKNLEITITKSNRNYKVVIKTEFYNVTVRGVAEDPSMMYAINRAIDDVKRKIRKVKTKFTDKKRSEQISAKNLYTEDNAFDSTEIEPQISKIKKVPVAEMSDKQALFQAEMLGHSFFVYKESTVNVAVLYKRVDGTYGKLIIS